ncbi:glycosyltransferase [Roseiflexus sp.]|uniref:glycosyltransferase n=1 Tax=Roseiflexus sp. TaxID=2562120 RepID=UPI0021DBD6DF|nr:glycosyltransferase [Roseiflexus sp.]GIW03273.1 MAG: glycosyl transferase [Roseiflexus sp.]
MRPTITILASGTLGDVRPLAALGKGLHDAGFAVALATHPQFAPLVQAQGLAFRSIGGNPSDLLLHDDAALTFDGGVGRGVVATLRYIRSAQAIYARMLDAAATACYGSALIIVSLASCWGQLIATTFGIPCVWAPLQPVTLTIRFPSPLLPVTLSLGARARRLSYTAVELATWLPWRTVFYRWRARALGPRHMSLDPFALACTSSAPFVYGFSPHVVPPPDDWPPHHMVTGYWFLDHPAERLAPEIESFLAAGDPPIVIGFGSMGGRRPRDDAALALEALRLAQRRGILFGSADVARLAAGRRDVLVVPYAPHRLLFPRVAVAVHHGGAGTTAASLRAGIPTMTVPVGIDQPFWGMRVAAIGAGPPPLPRRRATPDRLAHAIVSATDDLIRVRAAAIGRLIGAEEGVARAVEVVARVMP